MRYNSSLHIRHGLIFLLGGVMSFFDQVSLLPPDPIFGLQAAFLADPREGKVDLSVGVYKTADLKTPILSSVKKAEKILLETEKSKGYLPGEGDKSYLEQVGLLTFGEEFWKRSADRIQAAQSIGGTGALRLGAEFLKQEVSETIYVSDPTWPNHRGVFGRLGMKVASYPYYDSTRQILLFEELCHFLNSLPARSIVVLHACCHNPTGADLSQEQWKALSLIFWDKNLVPFFDCAYQGFDRGMEEDAFALRLFAEAGHEMLVALSYSKNFSLYGERAGALFVVTPSQKIAGHVESKIKNIIRQNYSNPPIHGVSIVATILQSPALKKEWEQELSSMRERVNQMRNALAQALVARTEKGNFSFLENRTGLFSFCGLRKEQVERLIAEFAIYMTGDGRINITGLNEGNLDYVVNAILAVHKG